MDIFSVEFFSALLAIVVIDLVLAGFLVDKRRKQTAPESSREAL